MHSSKNRAVLWRYIIKHDSGLAPHIANGMCSLAVCKPRIRRYAKPGEWIMAFAPAAESKGDLLVKYVMKVADNPSFEGYCRDHIGLRRDAIYRYDSGANGEWFDNGYGEHSPSEKDQGRRDKGGEHALVAKEFIHFGLQPRNFRFELMRSCEERGLRADDIVEELAHRTQGQSKYCSQQSYGVFLAWIEGLPKDRKTPRHHRQFPKKRSPQVRGEGCR